MCESELIEKIHELLERNRMLREQIQEMFRSELRLVTAAGTAEGKMDVAVSKMNAAVKDIKMLGRMGQNICPVCAHYNHGEGSKTCISCPKMDNFEWRGLVKEG